MIDFNAISHESDRNQAQAMISLSASQTRPQQTTINLDSLTHESITHQSQTMTATDSTFSDDLKASDTRCHFFRLSAELRNRIYREVLVKKYSISIDTSGDEDYGSGTFAQPGLIRTCRQIRSEATSIYYLENHFRFDLAGVNTSKLFAFCEQTGGYWTKNIQSIYIHDDCACMSWSDMMTWLERYHAGEAPSCECDDDYIGSPEGIPYQLFLLIDKMDQDRQMEWAKVASILKLTKDIADATGPWTWD